MGPVNKLSGIPSGAESQHGLWDNTNSDVEFGAPLSRSIAWQPTSLVNLRPFESLHIGRVMSRGHLSLSRLLQKLVDVLQ
jgi:hypothetical protein